MEAKKLLEEARSILEGEEEPLPEMGRPASNHVQEAESLASILPATKKKRLSYEELEKIKELKLRERRLERLAGQAEGELKRFRKRELKSVRQQIARIMRD